MEIAVTFFENILYIINIIIVETMVEGIPTIIFIKKLPDITGSNNDFNKAIYNTYLFSLNINIPIMIGTFARPSLKKGIGLGINISINPKTIHNEVNIPTRALLL